MFLKLLTLWVVLATTTAFIPDEGKGVSMNVKLSLGGKNNKSVNIHVSEYVQTFRF